MTKLELFGLFQQNSHACEGFHIFLHGHSSKFIDITDKTLLFVIALLHDLYAY